MRMILERHTYAPELNQLHFLDRAGNRRGTMRAPGVLSHKEARAMFRPVAPHRVGYISTHYPAPLKWLERQRVGVTDYATALALLKAVKAQLAITGTATVKTKLVG
jgi:hypothetical protein